MRTFVAVMALVVAAAVPAGAQPTARCTRYSFPVGGQTVAATICATAPQGGSVAVSESMRSAGKSFTHTTSIDQLAGAAVSRGIDDVALGPLGLAYTLHLTLAYRNGMAEIEHALLLPGAVPLM